VKAFVGVTDLDWYRQLHASGPNHDEVNFWFPSPSQGFKALSVGEFFVFKTHVGKDPLFSNRIVGAGRFSAFVRLRLSEAWDLFGRTNGVYSLEQLRARIEKYRRLPIERFDDPEIGCVLLNQAAFFDEQNILPAPADFATNTVRGRSYELAELDSGHSVMSAILQHSFVVDGVRPLVADLTRGGPTITISRIGQQAFKAVIAENYLHHCAITGDKVRPVLEAAHILPVAEGGEHRVDNGLLLRSDVHTLFDRGYLGVDLDYRLRVSPAIREQFGNGDWFYSREGVEIALPEKKRDRPNKEFLEWHNDEVFKAA
jgi:putative restriction endonuclease